MIQALNLEGWAITQNQIRMRGNGMTIRRMGVTLGLAVGLLTSIPAQAGEVVSKAADKITISGYTQGRAGYVADVPDSLINSAIFVRRARIKVSAKINDRTWSQIQVDFASSRLIKDAIVGIDVSKALTVMAQAELNWIDNFIGQLEVSNG